MSTQNVVPNILSFYYPDWKKTAPLPPDLLLSCLDYLVEKVVHYHPDSKGKDTTNKSMRGVLVNGWRHGVWTEWHNNGARISRSTYFNGVYHGKHKAWFWDGGLEEKGSYVYGKKDGRWITYCPETVTRRVLTDQMYSHGKLHGLSHVYSDVYGHIESKTYYKHGKKHGTETLWFEFNNVVISELNTYKNGKKHGVCKSWYFNGVQHSETSYVKGKKHGDSIEWENCGCMDSCTCDDHRIIAQGRYENGEKVGVWKELQTKVVAVRYKSKSTGVQTKPAWRL